MRLTRRGSIDLFPIIYSPLNNWFCNIKEIKWIDLRLFLDIQRDVLVKTRVLKFDYRLNLIHNENDPTNSICMMEDPPPQEPLKQRADNFFINNDATSLFSPFFCSVKLNKHCKWYQRIQWHKMYASSCRTSSS